MIGELFTFPGVGMMVGLIVIAVLIYLDGHLLGWWSFKDPPGWPVWSVGTFLAEWIRSGKWLPRFESPEPWLLSFSPPGWVVGALLGAAGLLQAGPIHHCLARETVDEVRIRPWLRALRFLLAGVPLFGLYVLPGWRWLMHRRPAWALRRWQPALRLDVLSRRASRISRWSPGMTFIISLWILLSIAFVCFFIWLAEGGEEGRLGLWVISGAAHLIAFVGMLVHLRDRAGRARLSRTGSRLLCLLSLFWLLPVPFLSVLGFLGYGLYERGERWTLSGQVYDRRPMLLGLPLWRSLMDGWNQCSLQEIEAAKAMPDGRRRGRGPSFLVP